MADQIRRSLRRNRQRAISQCVLDETKISEETYKTIFRDFWEPSEILSRAADRLRSSSLDISDEEHDATNVRVIQDVESETGVDITHLLRSINLLIESLEEKTTRVSSLESELEDAEQMITDYNSRIQRFADDLTVIDSYVDNTLEGQERFLNHVRDSFTSELCRRNLYDKLVEHKKLIEQVRQIRPVIRALVVKNNEDRDSTMTICKICMEHPVKFTIDPCGHCYCEGCSARAVEDGRCFQCRRVIQKMIKLYM
jgi:hypothetical protein